MFIKKKKKNYLEICGFFITRVKNYFETNIVPIKKRQDYLCMDLHFCFRSEGSTCMLCTCVTHLHTQCILYI